MRTLVAALTFSLAFACLPAPAGDAVTARALAEAAAKLRTDGKPEKARTLLYKALAHDERCPEALLELGRIFEEEGNTAAAANFYSLALPGLAEPGRAQAGVIADVKRRLQTLNPYVAKTSQLAEEYALELTQILKKSPDSLTQEETAARVADLHLDRYVPEEKLPKVERRAPAAPAVSKVEEPDTSRPPSPRRTSSSSSRPEPKREANNVPPDVERALRAAGWTTITGTWRLVRANVYEVTDGRLEAAKTNGAAQVQVHKSEGLVALMVRYNEKHVPYISDLEGFETSTGGYYTYYYGPGYGYTVKGSSYAMYAPYYSYRGEYYPYRERCGKIPDAPKHLLTVQSVANPKGVQLEFFLDGKREKTCNYPLTQEGPFVIRVIGTATIEQPQAAGQ